MRLFTALDLPAEVRTAVARLQAPDAIDARWTPTDQYHVTLRFIGDASAEEADRYESALGQLDVAAAACRPYGLDVLPSRDAPSVLIVGLERTDTLLEVYRAVSDALERAGVAPETRPFRPHVTLARLNDVAPETVHQFLRSHETGDLPTFRADRVHLYESTLTSDGAVHEQRASYPLGD